MFRWLLLVALTAAPAAAQVNLTDAVKPGDCFQYEVSLTLGGKLKVDRDARPETLTLAAKAAHAFAERVEAVDAKGSVSRALRHYTAAGSESDLAGERAKRELAADRRLVVAQRTADGSNHFSPAGPLSREELELVAEHFDTLCLPGLLPGKDVNPGDTWAVGPEAAQHACLFEGLVKAELTGKLTDLTAEAATFTVTGSAEGIESGALARVNVSATGKFDRKTSRLVELTWQQADARDQGPASPAAEVNATITVKRTPLAAEPAELNADVRAKVPADGAVPEVLTQLRYADAAGRYQFVYPRDWRIVGRTADHLVLRLLDKGEFAAQATVTTWKKADPGAHSTPAEFKELIGKLPGWEPEQILDDGPIGTDAGRWLYRTSAKGKQDGIAVVQTFYLLAGPGGDQLTVTVLARAEKAAKVGTRDLALVNAVDFPAKK